MVDGEPVGVDPSLTDFPVRELLARADGGKAIFVKGERFFTVFNNWIAGLGTSLRGVSNVLTVKTYRYTFAGDGYIYFGCSIRPDLNDLQKSELQHALEDLPSGHNLHFNAIANAIFLPISFEELDRGFAPSIVDDEAFILRDPTIDDADIRAVMAEVVAVGRAEMADIDYDPFDGALVRRGAAVEAGDGEDTSLDLGPDQDGDGEGMPG